MLPGGDHAQFLAEYTAAVEGALRPEQFRQLQELLRMWRLRAVAYSGTGYEERLAAASHGGAAGVAPAEQVIPGWPGRGPGEVVTGPSSAAVPRSSSIRCLRMGVMRSSSALRS
ncbi:MAG: DUF6247 family protein [Actinomycetota bacterium]|nr:DUF6247 family protein [Actinomycetota bacterium]